MQKTKVNVFGIIERTPGQNLIAIVSGCDLTSTGVPPYRYGDMFDILNAALTADEVELLDRGFGFTRQRQKQKEIAAEFGLSRAEVSTRAWKCVDKLQQSPFKKQLMKLTPSLEELFSDVERLKKENVELRGMESSEKVRKELTYRLNCTKAELEKAKAKNTELEKANATLSYDLQSAGKKISSKERELKKAQNIIIQLNENVTHERARSEAVMKAFNAAVQAGTQAANAEFIRCVRNVEIGNALDALGFSESTIADLKRAKITNVVTLLKSTERVLHALKVHPAAIEEIKEKLAAKGLSLKVG